MSSKNSTVLRAINKYDESKIICVCLGCGAWNTPTGSSWHHEYFFIFYTSI